MDERLVESGESKVAEASGRPGNRAFPGRPHLPEATHFPFNFLNTECPPFPRDGIKETEDDSVGGMDGNQGIKKSGSFDSSDCKNDRTLKEHHPESTSTE